MDHIDKMMLQKLWINCRISFRNLGSFLGLSAPSVKRRVDRLVESGAIYDFYVMLSEDMLDVKRALVFVHTDPSVPVEEFSATLTENQGIFRVLTLLNGEYLLTIMYPKEEGFQQIESYIWSLNGVKKVEVFPLYRSENCLLKGKKMPLSDIQRRVLSCLVRDARMSASDISKKTGMTTRKVLSTIKQLQENRSVVFSVRWKTNLGKGLSFILKIKYRNSKIDVMKFNNLLINEYPTEFWYSFLPESSPFIFSVFLVDSISEVYGITESIKEMPYVDSVENRVSYAAITLDPPTRIELVKILQHDGFLHEYPARTKLETDIIV